MIILCCLFILLNIMEIHSEKYHSTDKRIIMIQKDIALIGW